MPKPLTKQQRRSLKRQRRKDTADLQKHRPDLYHPAIPTEDLLRNWNLELRKRGVPVLGGVGTTDQPTSRR